MLDAVHSGNEMPKATIISGSVLVERTFGVFISRLVHYVHESGAIRDLGGVRSRDWPTDAWYVPVQCNGDRDWRGWYLDVK